MNCVTVRQYWCSKYENKFGKLYQSEKRGLELHFLKSAIDKYGYYSVLEAIDKFFLDSNERISSIIYFANPKYFETKYFFQNNLFRISKYKRFLPLYPLEIRDKVKKLVEEYVLCSHEMASDYDLVRKKEILEELEKLTSEYFSTL